MAESGGVTEVKPAQVPRKPREIKIVDPQKRALESLAAEKAALIAAGEDHAREEAEKVRQQLEDEASKAAKKMPQVSTPEKATVYTHGVKIHVHPGETSFDPLTKEPTISGVGEKQEKSNTTKSS